MSANAEIIAELRRVLNERDEAREQLDLTKRELGRWVDRETKAVRERDSYQRQLDAIGDAIVTSITKRIEPRISRHPVSVVMAAGSLIAKIGEAIGCEFEDGDDLLEAVKELARECDEARTSCPDCAMYAERSARWHDDMQRAERERDEAQRARDQYLRERDLALLAEERWRESLEELEEAIDECLPGDDDDAPLDCVERAGDKLRELARERDEARAEVEWLRTLIYQTRKDTQTDPNDEITDDPASLLNSMFYEIVDSRDAYRRGAEAMREAAANALARAGHGTLCDTRQCEHWGRYVRALPIPEEP